MYVSTSSSSSTYIVQRCNGRGRSARENRTEHSRIGLIYKPSSSLSILRQRRPIQHMLSLESETGYHYAGKYEQIIGIDEAGRGPLAGPVVIAALCMMDGEYVHGIKDSKQTSEHEREELYALIVADIRIKWSVSIIEHDEIDSVNILQATMNGMHRATSQLLESNPSIHAQRAIALVDGNRCPLNMPVHAEYVIKVRLATLASPTPICIAFCCR